MALPLNALPLRWPSGPLEISRREKIAGFTASVRATLERWHQPASLEFLNGTAVDCLVISWAAGSPADAEQQRTAGPLLEAARRRNLAVIGWVDGAVDHNAAIASAKAAGLDGLAIRNFKGASEFPVIAWSERAGVPWDSTAPAVAIGGNVWPGINIASGGADASAGPTSLPWLDSNGWYIQMARARLRADLWMTFDPPGKGTVVPAQSYVNAICDSEVAGARWVISLDDSLRAALADGAAPALATWKRIAEAAAFFREHAEWRSYRSLGVVGVVSNYTGDDFERSGEILNLMARRDLLFRVVWTSRAAAEGFAGLKALVYTDKAAPDAALKRKIGGFVEQGGLLVAGPQWGAQGKPAPPDFETQFDVRLLGKGRLAIARKEIEDPYQVAVDTQFLLSHRHDLMKIYNSGSSGCTRFAGSPDGKKAVLQCLSYAPGGRGGLRTIWVRRDYGTARLWAIGAAPVPLEPSPSEEYVGVEYRIPEAAPQSYLALDFESK